ncbi:MAG: efflux RND transporter periplasmic adaptor subunit [Rhodoglobus sp.]
MTKKKKWIVAGAVSAVSAAAIALGAMALAPVPTAESPPVQTAAVTTETITATVTGRGSIEAASKATAAFRDGGTVTSIAVVPGQVVTAGQQLATIDSAPADRILAKAKDARWAAGSAFDTANAQLAAAQNAAAAARAAAAAPPPAEPDASVPTPASLAAAVRDADAQVVTAQSAVVQANVQVADADRDVQAAEAARAATTLTAPIAGTVVAVNGTVGSAASGGGSSTDAAGATTAAATGLIQIADTSTFIVTAAVPEADITTVAVGQAASISLPSNAGVTIPGTVTAVSPTPTNTDGVVRFPVTVQLSEIPDGVRLGLSAIVTITTQEAAGVLAVPIEAVSLTSTTEGTVELQNAKNPEKSKTAKVNVGLIGSTLIEIREGLAIDDVVIIPQVAPTGGTGGGDFPSDVGGNFG